MTDETNRRVIDLPAGNQIIMQRIDPYGMIRVSLKHGELPTDLQGGTFTTWASARKALASWMDTQIKKFETPSRVKKLQLEPRV